MHLRATKNHYCQLLDVRSLLYWACNTYWYTLQGNLPGNSWGRRRRRQRISWNYYIKDSAESSMAILVRVAGGSGDLVWLLVLPSRHPKDPLLGLRHEMRWNDDFFRPQGARDVFIFLTGPRQLNSNVSQQTSPKQQQISGNLSILTGHGPAVVALTTLDTTSLDTRCDFFSIKPPVHVYLLTRDTGLGVISLYEQGVWCWHVLKMFRISNRRHNYQSVELIEASCFCQL